MDGSLNSYVTSPESHHCKEKKSQKIRAYFKMFGGCTPFCSVEIFTISETILSNQKVLNQSTNDRSSLSFIYHAGKLRHFMQFVKHKSPHQPVENSDFTMFFFLNTDFAVSPPPHTHFCCIFDQFRYVSMSFLVSTWSPP